LKDLAGDIFHGGKEDDEPGYFIEAIEALEGVFFDQRRSLILAQACGHWGGQHSGQDGIDLNLVWSKLPGQRGRKTQQSRFGGGIRRLTTASLSACEGGNIDDVSSALVGHGDGCGAATKKGPFEIDRKLLFPGDIVDLPAGIVDRDSGVVDEDIHGAPMKEDGLNHLIHLTGLRDVSRYLKQVWIRLVKNRMMVLSGDSPVLGKKLPRQFLSQSAGGSGDEHHFFSRR